MNRAVEGRRLSDPFNADKRLGERRRVVVRNHQLRVVVELYACLIQAGAELDVFNRGVGEPLIEAPDGAEQIPLH